MVIETINDITFGRDTCLRFGLNELPQNTKTKIYAKNPPRRGEQNPLMWGFIPHAVGENINQILFIKKTGDMELSSLSPAYCTLGMSIVDLYSNSYTKVYVTVVSYFRAVRIDKPIADG